MCVRSLSNSLPCLAFGVHLRTPSSSFSFERVVLQHRIACSSTAGNQSLQQMLRRGKIVCYLAAVSRLLFTPGLARTGNAASFRHAPLTQTGRCVAEPFLTELPMSLPAFDVDPNRCT